MAQGAKESIRKLVGSLLGISAFDPPTAAVLGPELSDSTLKEARRLFGGSLEPIPQVRLRWYPPDIERAQRMATTGNLTLVGQLCESMKIDGVYRGLLDARTSVVSFPKRFYGDNEIVDVLLSKNASDRNVYDEMIPETEARLIAGDGVAAGVGIGEMVPVVGRNFPVLVRRFPQNLFYWSQQNAWYYRTTFGYVRIRPGEPDEHGNMWVLHIPGGRLAPWNSGLWNTCGRSYINKTQTIFARQSYEMKHSHPARVATAALGATNAERSDMLDRIIRWALNAAFSLPVGWDIKLVESNGRGIEVYDNSIKTYNEEMATAICGSAVMLQGTAGFSNMDVFRVVQTDLIKTTSRGWDHTVNTQILPAFIGARWGEEALSNAVTVETDVSAPKDRKVEADTMTSLGLALQSLLAAAKAAGITDRHIDAEEIFARFGIPLSKGAPPEVGTDPAEAGDAGNAGAPALGGGPAALPAGEGE